MDLSELFALVLIAAGVWLWLDSLKAREAAVAFARRACHAENMLLLDDTVAIRSLRWGRDADGRLQLRRTYGFEYSDTGDNRRTGSLTLLGHEVEMLYLRPRMVTEGVPEKTVDHDAN